MSEKDFGCQSPGSMTRIPLFLGSEHAFNPHPLPPSWEFPNSLWPLLQDATGQLMLLEGIGRTLPNPSLLLRPLRDREAILSSRMEGTYATPRELLLFELDPRQPESESDPRNQQREVANYAGALDLASQSPQSLGLPLIRQLHAVLMDGVRGENKEPGRFRDRQVGIGLRGGNARFVPPAPEKLQDHLDEFDRYIKRHSYTYDPLVECFLVHYQFETIHPFSDGNGRVGRLLLTLMIQQFCGMTRPWLHMSEYFAKDHIEYCEHLYRVSTHAAWEEWVSYCLQGVAALARGTIGRCDRLLTLREDFNARLLETKGAVRLGKIVDYLFNAPMIAVADLPELLEVTYPTAKSDVNKLVKIGVLKELAGRHPKTYYSPEIFAIAYEGLEED